MKLVFILDEDWNSALSFLGLSIAKILQCKHDIVVYCPKDSYVDKNFAFEKYYISNFRIKNPLKQFKNLFQLRKLLKKTKPDIVFTIRGDATFLSCLIKNNLSFKLVRIFGEDRKPHINSRCLDVCIFSSDKYKNLYKNTKSVIINGVIDINKFKPDKSRRAITRGEYGIANDDFLYGFIGRTSHVKGIFLLIEAFSRIKNAKLFLLTYETEISIHKIERYAKKLGMEKNIIIENRFREDLVDIINSFDVGVISSIGSEAIARVALEFLACGLPVVATDVGCLSQVIDQTCGVICRPTTSELAQALSKIAKKDLKILSIQARQKAFLYSFEEILKKIDTNLF